MSDIPASNWDHEEQLTRVRRLQEESFKFSEESRKLVAEERKLLAEDRKLQAEAMKMHRDRDLAPWQVVITAMGAGAALFAAGAAFVKVFLH